jgi:hypothetical protein
MLDPELTGAKVGQGVRIERCRFLEEAGPCAGTCMNNCKVGYEHRKGDPKGWSTMLVTALGR